MTSTPLPGPLVDADWLAAHLDHVTVVDSRWYLDGRSGADAHRAGHVPGARWVDLDTELAGPPAPGAGRHPLPDPEVFAAAMGRLGVEPDSPVVVYDDTHGAVAARLWWMLDTLGHPVAVLDGGIQAWTGPLEQGDVADADADVAARPWPVGRFATADEVTHHLRGGGTVVDARTPERYRGEPNPVDDPAGHVPGAVNVPWAANVGEDGRFVPPDRLASVYADAGVDPSAGVIAYCGSGVTACCDLLALRLLGATGTRLYVGSWSGWSADDRPVATGSTP